MTTDRLLLRPFSPTDAGDIYRLNADPEVMRYLPKDEVFAEVAAARSFLIRYREGSAERPYERWACLRKSDGAWLGWCGLKLQENGETDLGFRFHRRYWGRGYGSEAARAWVSWGFATAGLPRIVARTAEGNVSTQRLLTKLGFVRRPEGDHTEDGIDWWNYDLSREEFLAH